MPGATDAKPTKPLKNPCNLCQTVRAILKRPKTGQQLCKECFFHVFETEIHNTIVDNKLFNRGDRVAIGASGGKDSTVLAYVMKLLNDRYSYGLDLVLLSIDEGITGYRDDSLETVKRNRDQYQIPLLIVSYKDLYGWSMDDIVKEIGRKNNCTFCGVFRRQALDRGAIMLNVDHIVTGHNADDIAETVLMNILRGDLPRLQRCTSIITNDTSEDSSGIETSKILRSKPFKYTYEKEIVMYAYFKKLDYFSTECIYSPNAYRGHARVFLKDLEAVRRTAIVDIIHSGEALSASVQANESTKLPTMSNCTRCGYISSNELCKACLLLEGLNKGLPQLGIGHTTKIRRMHEAANLASGLSSPASLSSPGSGVTEDNVKVVTHIKDLGQLATMPTSHEHGESNTPVDGWQRTADGLPDYTAEPRGRAKGVEWKLRAKGRNFVDFCRIKVSGGQGGDGCVSFHREKFVAFGQPNGGNGGRGGNVIFEASSNETSLQHIPHTAAAPRGVHGKGSLMHGHAGKDLIIKVPMGTIIREVPSPEKERSDEDEWDVLFSHKALELGETEAKDKEMSKRWVLYPRLANSLTALPEGKVNYFEEAQAWVAEEDRIVEARRAAMSKKPLLLDVNEHTEDTTQFMVGRGGGGGYGNPHFLTTQNRAPKYATRGREGQTRWLTLELKTIADAGLVGLPNAGKSTFLQAVSNAHPAIAPYPFTTLNPYIGTVDYSDSYQVKVADIPGLIRGAHMNVGLGHSFLRHVERSKVLVYVIDIAAEFGIKRKVKGVDDWTPEEDLEQQEEVKDAASSAKPSSQDDEDPLAVNAEYSQPFEDWKTLLDELEAYQPGLTRRPSMIIANKADVTEVAPKNLRLFQKLVHEEWAKRRVASDTSSPSSSSTTPSTDSHDIKIVPVSAKYKKNIVKVTSILREIVEAEKAKESAAAMRKLQREREEEEEALAFKATRRNIMNNSQNE
ncbi:cytosolic thiouridylase subunit Ctu1 [Linnemannia exigua]|uniref:Cytoplasmic tRNA 2-thiolation protein 1 n=1 Tax=Linnemannia exigua TaxID=604196 RepID=A0AAD4DHS9_9FUNG|nr:cytosolic thiouridylase subunit Ctu1 [Linnemannia exigua]